MFKTGPTGPSQVSEKGKKLLKDNLVPKDLRFLPKIPGDVGFPEIKSKIKKNEK